MTVSKSVDIDGNDIWLDENGYPHSENDQPALIKRSDLGKIFEERWYKHGKVHRSNGPARILYAGVYSNVVESNRFMWYIDGLYLGSTDSISETDWLKTFLELQVKYILDE